MSNEREDRNQGKSSSPREHAGDHLAEAPSISRSADPLPSVNWHITLWCNLACRYCFQQSTDRVSPQGPRLGVTLDQAFRLLDELWTAGCRKITFAGGEPTLVPDLPALVRHAWALGMNVMIVTNGTGLTDRFLQDVRGCVTAVKFSVDSPHEKTLIALGRSRGDYLRRVKEAVKRCRAQRIAIMMNTVVTSLNWNEDLRGIVDEIRPIRWKVFQSLWIAGQNTDEEAKLAASPEEYRAFLWRHRGVSALISEDNEAMTDSYVMIDPWGRFFQNSGGTYHYSDEILVVGVERALSQCGGWSRERFLLRGGDYEVASQPKSPIVQDTNIGQSSKPESAPSETRAWRIRVDSRADVGTLFNLKGRLLDWIRNNPGGNPSYVRIRVNRAERAVYLEPTARAPIPERVAQEALRYAKAKATKSQRFVAASSLEKVGR